MTIRKVVAAEDNDAEELYEVEGSRLSPGHSVEFDMSKYDDDPFLLTGDELKKITGLSANNKRSLSNKITKYHRGQGGAKSKKIEDEVITGYNAFDVVAPPYNLDYLAKLYELSSPHYAAINAKVSNIVGLGFDFVESPFTKRKLDEMSGDAAKTDKHRKKLARAKDELHDLLDGLNESDTLSEILDRVWKDYEATGNGYIEIGRKENGQIGYIGHIPSTSLRVRRQRDGFVQIFSNRAVFFRNFGDTDTPDPLGDDPRPNEIIHLYKYAPASQFYGVPDVIAAKNAIAGNEFADRYNLDYFENKAIPRHLITLKGATLGTQTANNLLEFFETGLKGKNHRSLFIPLPADGPDGKKVEFKIEPIEATVQDASFNNFKKANQNSILMAHRVPITKVSIADATSLAVARDADKTFKEQVCQPEQKRLEKKLNRIVKEFTDLFILKLNEMTLTDADTQSKIWERLAKIGAITRNEIRAEQGRPGIDKGDEIIDMNKPANEQMSESRATRQRDSERSANATDSAGEGRNPKGDGRTG